MWMRLRPATHLTVFGGLYIPTLMCWATVLEQVELVEISPGVIGSRHIEFTWEELMTRRRQTKRLNQLPDLKAIREHEDELAESSSYDYDGLEAIRRVMRGVSPERVDYGDRQRGGTPEDEIVL